MKAMILAAGYGTRLRPVTYTIPKPMVPLCNRPLVAWAVEAFLAAGVDDIIVNLHHLPEPMERYLRGAYGAKVHLHFSFEQNILGTGGGLRRVRQLLENEEDFFLVNGDTVQFPLWNELAEARRRRDAVAAITLRHPPENDRFTAVWLEDGLVTGFGKGRGEPLMFSGSHVISSRIFGYLPDKEFSGIVDEVYQPLLAQQRETIAAIVDDGLWFDIGTAQRYLSASSALLEATVRGEAPIVAGSRVRGDSIVDATASGNAKRSTIGAGSVVHGEVSDSAIWDDCVIGGSARVERCIVAHGVEIRGLDLSDALICRDHAAIPQDPSYTRRDGLVVIPI